MIKLVLTSDLHGHLPIIPKGDLLIISGDLCVDRYQAKGWHDMTDQALWIKDKLEPWLEAAPVKDIVATWGNHDFVGRVVENPAIYVDTLVEVQGLKIWVSPWSNTFGPWAFMKDPKELIEVYDKIPEGVDIIVSHQPPYSYGDYATFPNHDGDRRVGSKELLSTIERVKPRLVVCGHIHGGYGDYNHDNFDGSKTRIMNVSLVNEKYKPVRPIVEIDF